ncbi:MAG: glycoside hydrolase [Actinobacteria bacterium]|nr:glycoside hydrolase [Actinomycetota bacterium]
MKLTVLGAGVRTPLLLKGLVRRALPVEEVVLHDSNPHRLETMTRFSSYLCERWGAGFKLRPEPLARAAIEDAGFVLSAVRVGGDDARVIDEEVPLKHDVLGQETTGPGGFAMALRTIPVALGFARLIEAHAPQAWLINFTNPAGLITEALTRHSAVKVIGICDSPTGMKRSIAAVLGVHGDNVDLDYFGLNHLGWVRRVLVDGHDRLPELLERYGELQRVDHAAAPFDAELVRDLEMLPNEYLYYFYYRERAVANIKRSGATRARELQSLNAELWRALGASVATGGFAAAQHAYEHALLKRSASYMARECSSDPRPTASDDLFEGEGYEGLAMAVMTAITSGLDTPLIVNVPQRGAVEGFDDGDVFELPCRLGAGGATPIPVGRVPDVCTALLGPVKAYEKLTVQAAVDGSYGTAVRALSIHPLVASYSLARVILGEYLEQHGDALSHLGGAGPAPGSRSH